MQLLVVRNLSLVLLSATLFALASTSFAFAQDVSTETNAPTNFNVGVPPPPNKPRPLQILHDKRLEVKNDARTQFGELKEQKMDIRANMKMNLKAATSGPLRHDIVRQAQERLGEMR